MSDKINYLGKTFIFFSIFLEIVKVEGPKSQHIYYTAPHRNDYAKKSDLTLRADLIWCIQDYIVRGFHIIVHFFHFICKMNVGNVFHPNPIFIGWFLLRQKISLKSNIFSSAKWPKTKLTHEPFWIVDSMEMKYEC